MKCPECGCTATRVTDTARSYGPVSRNRGYMVEKVKREGRLWSERRANFSKRVDNANVRRRVCPDCGTAFLTLESPCFLEKRKTRKPGRAR